MKLLKSIQTLLSTALTTDSIGIDELRVLVYIMDVKTATALEIGDALGMSQPTVKRSVAHLISPYIHPRIISRRTKIMPFLEIVRDEAAGTKKAALTQKSKDLLQSLNEETS